MTKVLWMSENNNKLKSQSPNLGNLHGYDNPLWFPIFQCLLSLMIRITIALEDTWIRVVVPMADLCERGFSLSECLSALSVARDTLDLSGSLRVVALRLCVGGRFLLPADFLCHTMTFRLSSQTSFSGISYFRVWLFITRKQTIQALKKICTES